MSMQCLERKFQPADTIVLKASISRTYFSFVNLHGDTDCPVTITNEGGQVKLQAGFNIGDSTYIIIDGTGTSGTKYGFYISDYPSPANGPAIDINHKSSNIEAHHVEMFQKTYGVVAKQDPVCDASYNYPNWTFDNIFYSRKLHSRYEPRRNVYW